MHFGSDNQTGASPQMMAAIAAANAGYSHGYGDDAWTAKAIDALRNTFDCDLDAFFVLTGTAANSLALSCMTQSWECILCHSQSHILNDESTAPEFFSNGARLIGISQGGGKLAVDHLHEYFHGAGSDNPHNPRASVLSVTQASENGLIYRPDELQALCAFAHEQQLKVHMDGARFANAVASSKCTPADLTWKAGVDVLSLGATKNGALAAEAVIFFDKTLAQQFGHRRKRSGHLVSKSRFIGAQFVSWLHDDHWLTLAAHANAQAASLAKNIETLPNLRLMWPAEANELFIAIPTRVAEYLRSQGAEFYAWPSSGLPPKARLDESEAYIRLVTSYRTTDEDIASFCGALRRASV